MVDKSLHFGNQNYFFIKTETIGEYDYVGYQNKKGSTLLARFKTDGSEGLYTIRTGTFSVVWANKEDYTYTYPANLVDPTI